MTKLVEAKGRVSPKNPEYGWGRHHAPTYRASAVLDNSYNERNDEIIHPDLRPYLLVVAALRFCVPGYQVPLPALAKTE